MRITQTDPLNCGAGCAAESAYAYVGNNPAVYVDPTGMRRSGVQTMGTNVVAQAGQESAPEWLLKKSFWSSTFKAPTTGFCGDLQIGIIWAYEGQACFVDDGHRLGTLEWLAIGPGTPAASVSGQMLLSNAKQISSLRGWGVCVGVSGGEGPTVGAKVCWSTQRPLDDPSASLKDLAPSFSSTWVINAGAGVGLSALPFVEGHALIGKTFVQEIWKYDKAAFGYVKRVCGRVISNPLQAQFPPVCPFLTPWAG
jgi:hypothetical protein